MSCWGSSRVGQGAGRVRNPEHSEQQGIRAVSKKHRLLLDKAVGSVSPVLKEALFSVLVRG